MMAKISRSKVGTIDIVEVIDGHPIGSFQIKLILLCGLVAMLDGFDTQSIGFVAPIIAPALGININAFGPIFSSNLIGMAIGAMVLGPLADRVGRKAIITLSTFAFGLFSLLTILVDSSASLMTYRFFTGLGLGAAMPNIIALTAEYAPKRARAWLVTIMFTGFPLGAVIGGIISAQMVPVFGWKSVFLLGGASPILLAILLVASLPESIRFLVSKGRDTEKVSVILKKIAANISCPPGQTFSIPEKKLESVSVSHLFSEGRALGTLLLWVPFFMNLLLLFFMYNWLPAVLQQAGFPITKAIIATVLFNVGGIIGGLIQARIADRKGPFGVLGAAYAVGAIFIAIIGMVGSSVPLIMASVFAAGFCVVGAQFGANSLAASFYPTAVRATGIGWALGIGRVGSIVGPLIGGALMSLHWDFSNLFLIAAVPAACGAVAILTLGHVARKEPDLPSDIAVVSLEQH